MSNIDELIEQLRKSADFEDYPIVASFAAIIEKKYLRDAATALSTIQAENERLRAELERVKLVRCKDCKMSRPGGLGYVWCGPTAMPLDGFCSNGQQKED